MIYLGKVSHETMGPPLVQIEDFVTGAPGVPQ